MEYAQLVRALTAWALLDAANLAQLRTTLGGLIAKLASQDGGQMTAFTVPGQSAAYQHTMSLAELISAHQEALERASGRAGVVRRTSARFLA